MDIKEILLSNKVNKYLFSLISGTFKCFRNKLNDLTIIHTYFFEIRTIVYKYFNF